MDSSDSFVLWSYPIWAQCLNNFVVDCSLKTIVSYLWVFALNRNILFFSSGRRFEPWGWILHTALLYRFLNRRIPWSIKSRWRDWINRWNKETWTDTQGDLPFTWENRKFRLENQMVYAIPFGKLQKIWAVIWGDLIFLLFLVCWADLSFMFMHRSSTRVVCVNGKHPWLPVPCEATQKAF